MKFFFLCIVVLNCVNSAEAQKAGSKTLLDRVGDTVTVSGKIYSGAFLTNVKTKPTFLNLGDTNPSHRLMIRIEPEDRAKFSSPPETYLVNKQVSVTGVINNYKGTALIKISHPDMIRTEPLPQTNLSMPVTIPNIVSASPATVVQKTIENKIAKKLPDTLQQLAWVNKVAGKTAEQINKNLRVVEKEIPLRLSPNDQAPVSAILNRGIVISILDRSRKWSHIIVRTVDGSNSVLGFIKNRMLRHLKKLQ